MTHICVSDLTIIGSDDGLSPGRRQAIIRTNAGLLLITSLGTNFSEFLIEILIFSFKKMCLNMSSAKRRPFCLGLNVLRWVRLACFRVLLVVIWKYSLHGNQTNITYLLLLQNFSFETSLCFHWWDCVLMYNEQQWTIITENKTFHLFHG